MSKRQKAPATAASTVLRAKELLRQVTSFQGGIYHDMVEIARVLVPFSPKEHPLYYCPDNVHDVLALFPLPRVPLLVMCLPYMRDILFLDAAQYGNLDLLRLLEREYSLTHTPRFLVDLAAQHGHLEVLSYLHENAIHAGCTTMAMDGAAANGHLTTVQFLHSHRREGCTPRAMVLAAEHGHLDIVEFLHENVDEDWPIEAIKCAATSGHLAIVQYLCENAFGHTPDAIIAMAEELGDDFPEAKDLVLSILGEESDEDV